MLKQYSINIYRMNYPNLHTVYAHHLVENVSSLDYAQAKKIITFLMKLMATSPKVSLVIIQVYQFLTWSLIAVTVHTQPASSKRDMIPYVKSCVILKKNYSQFLKRLKRHLIE